MKEQVVDIAGVINKMRHQRMKMVQTVVSTVTICCFFPSQYIIIKFITYCFILWFHQWTLVAVGVIMLFQHPYSTFCFNTHIFACFFFVFFFVWKFVCFSFTGAICVSP